MPFYFLQGLSLGFPAGVSPGPFLAFLLSQTLQRGWRRAIWLPLAVLVTNGPIVIIVLLTLARMPGWFIRVLQIAGGLLLLYLAWRAFQVLRKPAQAAALPANPRQAGRGAFLEAVAVSGFNPSAWLFWSTVGGPLVLESLAISAGHAMAFILGFFLTLVISQAGYILLFATASRIDPRLTRALNIASAVALLLIGLYRLGQGLVG